MCIEARGKEDAHRKDNEKGDKPILSMDYKDFGEDPDEDDKMKMIIVKNETTGNLASYVCEQKGAADTRVIGRLADDVDMLGHGDIMLKGDGEPALVQVRNAIKEKKS